MMLSAMTMNGWVPGPGDNDWLGWACTLAYAFAAVGCWFAWRGDAQRPKLWPWILFLLVALGINKQLDLHLFIARVGKEVVTHEGWRHRWKLAQEIFVAMLGVAALVA